MDCNWQITETTSNVRRNIFSLTPGAEAHLATVISGSQSRQEQFERFIGLLEAVPEMVDALKRAQDTLRDISFLEDTNVRSTRLQLEALARRLHL